MARIVRVRRFGAGLNWKTNGITMWINTGMVATFREGFNGGSMLTVGSVEMEVVETPDELEKLCSE